jgi:TatD DNase family protein
VYRDLGLAFSFAGPVTYPGARRPIAAARAVPDALLLAETDAPDQAPAPHRGRDRRAHHRQRAPDLRRVVTAGLTSPVWI